MQCFLMYVSLNFYVTFSQRQSWLLWAVFSKGVCNFFFNFFSKGLRLIFVTLFLERILRTTSGRARAGVRQGQRQLVGGDNLLCERLHLGKVGSFENMWESCQRWAIQGWNVVEEDGALQILLCVLAAVVTAQKYQRSYFDFNSMQSMFYITPVLLVT